MKRALKIGLPAAAAALAVAGAVALAPSASAATEYQATLTITLTKGDSVLLRTGLSRTCYDFGTSKTQTVSVSVQPGETIALSSMISCYASVAGAFGGVTITSNGQHAEVTL